MPSKKQAIDREAVAADWVKDYGEPIDCPELRRVASLAAVERERSAVSALRALDNYAELLRRQRQEQIAFLDHPVHGEGVKLSERLEVELAATGERGERGRRARVASHVALLEGRVGRTKRGTPRGNVRSLSRYAHPIELLLALRLAQRSAASRADEMVSEILHRTPDWRWKATTQGADVALALAASEVAQWIQARHRNQSGQLDGRTSWRDVARCFEWYGHDLSHIGSKRGDALRNLAARIHKKQQAAEVEEVEAKKG